MKLTLECEQETDGRWIAEVPEIPGVLAYGATASEAMAKAQALARPLDTPGSHPAISE